MKQNKKLKSPPGVSDIYGRDCVLKSKVSSSVRGVFESFGYCEIQTPAFEYADIFGEDISSEAIKFIDSDGSVLALRPDMTTSISRAAASHLSDNPLPLRLFYIGSVYRSGESYKSARRKEYTQAGVELIGAAGAASDAEVIALTVKSLLACGLKDFQIELAHSGFFQGIADDCALSEEDADALRSLLDKKFTFGIEEFCSLRSIGGTNREVLTCLPTFFGGWEEVLEKYNSYPLNPASKKAIEELYTVCSVLRDYKMEKYITIDLGQIRSFKYYTGVIFRGLTTNAAFPICGGGRYDSLCGKFSSPLPATGAAIWVDRLSDALLRSSLAGDISDTPDAIIFSSPSRRAEAFEKAEKMRQNGKKVVLDVLSLSGLEAREYALARGISEIYVLEG